MLTVDLAGKTAVVTGAGQGLGRAAAAALHAAGANVAINYFEDAKRVNRSRAEKVVETLGDRAALIEADVRDAASVERLLDAAIERFGRLDIIVNNAGIVRDRTIKKMSPAARSPRT